MTDDKNIFERIGSHMTRRLWDNDRPVDELINKINEGRVKPMQPDEIRQLREYMRDPVKFQREFGDKAKEIRAKLEQQQNLERLSQAQVEQFKEFALGSGMRMNWDGSFYDPDTRTHYDKYGNEKE